LADQLAAGATRSTGQLRVARAIRGVSHSMHATAASLRLSLPEAPTNEMSYDATQFYNSALATVAGCGMAAPAFALLPPLSPTLRTRRLLGLALRDLKDGRFDETKTEE
jgi:uncharacterized membrane protein YccC